MSRKKNNNNKQRNYPPGSGTEYHKKHGSHVPDYGGNSTDPNAER